MQEYAPTLYYVQGGKNVVADALSRLPFSEEELSADENFAMTARRSVGHVIMARFSAATHY